MAKKAKKTEKDAPKAKKAKKRAAAEPTEEQAADQQAEPAAPVEQVQAKAEPVAAPEASAVAQTTEEKAPGQAPGEPEREAPTEKPEAADKEAEPAAESTPAPALPEGAHYIWGTGRRKKSVARVRIRPGTGNILINKREMDNYFHHEKDRQSVVSPLDATKMRGSWDIWVNVGGGGFTGQAGAVMMGLARALRKAAPQTEPALRNSGLLTRDARMPERKKYGQKGARKKFQFSKR